MSAVLPTGRIGPNAITRVAEALPGYVGTDAARSLFARAGLAEAFARPPQAMVEETDVARLHAELRASLGSTLAAQVARGAGLRTADYLLAHRIPQPVQMLLRALPAPWAARLLVRAITRHAWTFAGSGVFSARVGRGVTLEIRDNPLCRGVRADAPVCDFYAATFERLFRVLVHPATRVRETACEARGDDACRFQADWET
jgi:divinyl protochlorophyllide a 8-vinyl-reductase